MSVDNPHSVDAHNHNKASPVTHLVDSIGSFIISLTLVEFMPFIIIGDIVTLGVVSTKSPQIVSMFIRLTNVVTRRGLVKLSRGVATWRGHVMWSRDVPTDCWFEGDHLCCLSPCSRYLKWSVATWTWPRSALFAVASAPQSRARIPAQLLPSADFHKRNTVIPTRIVSRSRDRIEIESFDFRRGASRWEENSYSRQVWPSPGVVCEGDRKRGRGG